MPGLGQTLSSMWYSAVALTIAEKLSVVTGRTRHPVDKFVSLRRVEILETIDAAIIPQLLRDREGEGLPADVRISPRRAEDSRRIDPETVAEFTRLLIAGHGRSAESAVERLLADGVDDEALCTDLLTPAARLLGEWWEEDGCSFGDVTVGLVLLHNILRHLGETWEPEPLSPTAAGEILFVAPPGEQHILGLCMVSEFFLRANWNVRVEFPVTLADLDDIARSSRARIFGLTCSSEAALPTLKATVSALRNLSGGNAAHIMVGGNIFGSRPDLFAESGADSTSCDVHEAIETAARVFARLRPAIADRPIGTA